MNIILMTYIINFFTFIFSIFLIKFKDLYTNKILIMYIFLTMVATIATKNNNWLLSITPILIYIFIKDFKDFRIPHPCTLTLFVINLITILIYTEYTFKNSGITFGIALIVLYILYSLNKIGGGDMLLIPNLILFMNVKEILIYLYMVCILAIVVYFVKKSIVLGNSKGEIPLGTSLVLGLYIFYTAI